MVTSRVDFDMFQFDERRTFNVLTKELTKAAQLTDSMDTKNYYFLLFLFDRTNVSLTTNGRLMDYVRRANNNAVWSV